ncbi:MAG TPA: YbaB/EbfC family nucleoid-associated protein [Polyangiaceae bacterium]|nr:YbaB/EbfC family nucleoid-associated protein [Polyangiaceae bacterium]
MQFRGGMSELMRQASRMQRKVEQRKKELQDATVEVGVGNDQVKVTATGGMTIVKVSISPALLTAEGLEMAQDLVVAGVNAALKKAQEMVDAELEKVTKGIKMPGML